MPSSAPPQTNAQTRHGTHAREPAFTLNTSRAIVIDDAQAGERGAEYLAHWLARHPNDLTRHLQRIHLHLERARPDQLYSALVDLFIALGPHGEDLRRRMLKRAKRILDEEQYYVLDMLLPVGLDACHRLGDIPGSVLSRPVNGNLDLVAREAKAAFATSTLVEARSLIDEGYLETARDMLEQALAGTPDDTELAEELLLIYRATRNVQGYRAFMHILERADALPDSWRRDDILSETAHAA